MNKSKTPVVAVLLATYNGMRWIEEQVNSILGQRDVNVRLVVSDDNSTDGTFEWIQSLARDESRILVLPRRERFGSAAKNFYRLILDVDLEGVDYFALADQDDIWLEDKLKKQIGIARQENAAGVSSNVVAFWPDGTRALIEKAQPLREFDFLFESSGPGCTFLMTPWLIQEVRTVLVAEISVASTVEAHDWLIYAVCRASGKKWHISPVPTLKYRQHENNVLGANFGYKAREFRIKRIISGWYRREIYKVAELSLSLTSVPDVQEACRALMDKSIFSRFKVLGLVSQARRSMLDRCMLSLSILFFWSNDFISTKSSC